MAKLDEIAELLTEEIKGFENSISRLEKLHEELKAFCIRPDTSDIDFILKQYNDHQKKTTEEQQQLAGKILYQIKSSIGFPKWVVKLFWALLICVLLVLGYSIYQVSQISKKEKMAYKIGQDNAIGYYRTFFEESPKAEELYQEWVKTQNKK